MSKLFTVREVAELLKVNIMTIYRWIKEGKIKQTKIGRSVRIDESELNKFINQ